MNYNTIKAKTLNRDQLLLIKGILAEIRVDMRELDHEEWELYLYITELLKE